MLTFSNTKHSTFMPVFFYIAAKPHMTLFATKTSRETVNVFFTGRCQPTFLGFVPQGQF